MPVSIPPSTRGHHPDDDPIQATRSFEAPGAARRGRASVRPAKAPPAHTPTRRGTPRPDLDQQIASVRVITGDYRKVDDNEVPRSRTPSQTSLAALTRGPTQAPMRMPTPAPMPAAMAPETRTAPPALIRQAWAQGAIVGALALGIAWVVWLIARGA
jgi:hypothetical protein